MRYEKGEKIDYLVTFLEMTQSPEFDWPKNPHGLKMRLIRVENPSFEYFMFLYRLVGSDYEWTDMLDLSFDEVTNFLKDQNVLMYSLLREDVALGFFILDNREKTLCDLTYFGLIPEAIGNGLGSYLLKSAVKIGWGIEQLEKMTVNTNTLDHPRALPLYLKVGFKTTEVQSHSRIAKSSNKDHR